MEREKGKMDLRMGIFPLYDSLREILLMICKDGLQTVRWDGEGAFDKHSRLELVLEFGFPSVTQPISLGRAP